MAIGALIGGLVQRAGDKSYEKQQQDRNEALYRQKLQADYLIDDLKTNWDYLDEAGRASRYGLLEPLLGMKKGELGNMATFGEQVYKILPPFQSGGVQSAQRQSLDQLPTPGETGAGSATIMAPHTIPTPPERDRSLMMSQIPIVRKLQMKQLADEAMRQQALDEISVSPLPPHIREAAVAKQYGVNAIPVLTSEISADAKRDVAAQRAGEFRGAGRLIVRNGMPLPIKTTGSEEFILDPQQGWVPYVPVQGDEVWQKETPLGTVQGATDVYSLEKGGPNKGAVKPLGVGVRPRATASGSAAKSRSFRDEMALRKDFENHPITKQADETARQVKLAESAIARGSANFVAIDQALINVFNKMIDPNSVVREGEYARTIENTPLLNRIKGKVAAIQAGGAGLTPEERKELVDIAKRFAADSQVAFTTRSNEYRRMATDQGFNPDNVVIKRVGGEPAADPAEAKRQLIEYLKNKQKQLGGGR